MILDEWNNLWWFSVSIFLAPRSIHLAMQRSQDKQLAERETTLTIFFKGKTMPRICFQASHDGSIPTFSSHPLSCLYSWFHSQLGFPFALGPLAVAVRERSSISKAILCAARKKGHMPSLPFHPCAPFFSLTPSSLSQQNLQSDHPVTLACSSVFLNLGNIRTLSKRKKFSLPNKCMSITSAEEFWLYNMKILHDCRNKNAVVWEFPWVCRSLRNTSTQAWSFILQWLFDFDKNQSFKQTG